MGVTADEPYIVIEVNVGAPIDIGPIGAGARRYVPLTGGRVTGALTGTLIPGGDWQTLHDDGNVQVEARYGIQTDDGAAIEIVSVGVRAGSADVQRRLMAGEKVDPSEYYFRTAMRFKTGAPHLQHLNNKLFVGRGERTASLVKLEVVEVL